MKRFSKGFTLIELIILVAIVGIVAAIVGPAVCNAVGDGPPANNSRDVSNSRRSNVVVSPGTKAVARENALKFGEEIGYGEAACTKGRKAFTCALTKAPGQELMVTCPGHPGATCEPL